MTVLTNILEDSRIQTKAKGVAAYIFHCYPSGACTLEELVTKLKESRTYLYDCLSELESYDCLTKARTKHANGKSSTIQYQLKLPASFQGSEI